MSEPPLLCVMEYEKIKGKAQNTNLEISTKNLYGIVCLRFTTRTSINDNSLPTKQNKIFTYFYTNKRSWPYSSSL